MSSQIWMCVIYRSFLSNYGCGKCWRFRMPVYQHGAFDVLLIPIQYEIFNLIKRLSNKLKCYRMLLDLQMKGHRRRRLSAGWYSRSNNSVPSCRCGLTRLHTSSRTFSFAETASSVSSGFSPRECLQTCNQSPPHPIISSRTDLTT